MNNDSIEGSLEDLVRRLELVRGYVDRLNGQLVDKNERIFLAGGDMLWETDDGARFERNNPLISAKIRQITQDIHNILKD